MLGVRILGNFQGVSAELGELIKSNCATVAFEKAFQICDPFRIGVLRFNFGVGCRHDGEEESGR